MIITSFLSVDLIIIVALGYTLFGELAIDMAKGPIRVKSLPHQRAIRSPTKDYMNSSSVYQKLYLSSLRTKYFKGPEGPKTRK
jgi:hypothetical protein